MEKEVLAEIAELLPERARQRFLFLMREQGAAGLETVRAALEVPALAGPALDALGDLPAQESWDLLEQVAAGGGPSHLRKAARRAQHRLRSRGFHPAATAREVAFPAADQAKASFFDAVGEQFLRLVRPAQLGMAYYASFIVSLDGLLSCDYGLANRADVETYLLLEDRAIGGELVDVGLGYIARRVRQAVGRSRSQGKTLPEDYVEAARLLRDAPADTLADGLGPVAPADKPILPGEIQGLLRHPSMRHWRFPLARLSSYVDEWLDRLGARPLTTEEGLPDLGVIQARGQMTARIIADLVDEAERRRLVEQLREQARLLVALGERSRAEVAMRCAIGLEQASKADHPFLQELVGESMEVATRIAWREREEEESGPWTAVRGPGGPLWIPKPADRGEEGEEEDRPSSGLWLPGQ